jgi:hypothetical protein
VVNNDGLRIIITRGAQRSSSESPPPPPIWPRCGGGVALVAATCEEHACVRVSVSCVLERALSHWLACKRLMLLCVVTHALHA